MEKRSLNKTSWQAVVKSPRVSLEGKINSRVNRNNYPGNGHWEFDIEMGLDDKIGFVYVIHNNITNKSYIGRKFYKGTGELNKGKSTNWPWYVSSSKVLAKDIRTLGKENFEFICIEEYTSRGALSWAETWSICYVEAPSKRDMWYNGLINKVSWIVNEPITQKHKDTLELLIRRYYAVN